ncbi:hypothetical protein A8B78_20105 [Jannaschia sp. EhC01]|nr:hypothetical protein A8B78_20105 [Jannaschia sp. EhC01]
MTIQTPINPALDAFGKAIKAEREARKWSLATLAGEVLQNPDRKGYCSQVEKGLRNLSEGTIRSFARVLDLPASATDPLTGHLLPPEDDTTQSDAAATAMLQEVEALRDKLKLSEAIAVAIAYKYADGNPTDIEGALKGLEAALELAAKEQALGALPSNHDAAADKIIQSINEKNNRGEIDEAYADLRAEAARRAEAREAMLAEDGRIIDLLITQAALANDADGYAQAHLQKVQLDSPSAEDTFHRLFAFQQKQFDKGTRFGTPFALTAAAAIARKCMAIAPSHHLFAKAQCELGFALALHGTRIEYGEGIKLLYEAAGIFEQLLFTYTEADVPEIWAFIITRLAIAQQELGSRLPEPLGSHFIGESIKASNAALRVFTEEKHAEQWTWAKQNLAISQGALGLRTNGLEGEALLEKAAKNLEATLRVSTEIRVPEDWARETSNLASIRQSQGIRSQGPEGAAHLEEAVAIYDSTFRVYSKKNYPIDWARAQKNIASAKRSLAMHPATTDPRPHLEAALTHVDNALSVLDPKHMFNQHTIATALRDDILEALDAALPPSSSS